MDYMVFTVVCVILGIWTLWLGQKTGKNVDNLNDFFLAKRRLPLFGLTLTFLATQMGGGAIIGAGEAVKNYGLGALCYSSGLALGFFILALGVGEKFRKLGVSSIPETFLVFYKSKKLRIFSASLSIISLFLILISISISAWKFMISIGVESKLSFVALGSTTILYTVYGGLKAVVKTDILQILVIILILVFTAGYCMQQPGITMPNLTWGPRQVPWQEWVLMPMLFVLIGQDMGQRCFAAISPRTLSAATCVAGILLMLLSLIPIYLGLVGLDLGLSANDDGGSAIMSCIISQTNPMISSLFAVAILMAILSTTDSLVCAISLNFAYDILPALGLKFKLNTVRILTFLIGFSALWIAFYVHDIISLMIMAYKVSIFSLLVPIIFGLYLKRPSRYAAYSAMGVGIVGFFIETYLSVSWDLHVLLLSILAYLFMFFYTKRQALT